MGKSDLSQPSVFVCLYAMFFPSSFSLAPPFFPSLRKGNFRKAAKNREISEKSFRQIPEKS
jgi:hypothetical protein